METINIKLINASLGFNLKIASEKRLCSQNCEIKKGDTYLNLYTLNENKKITKIEKFCKNHYSICELCNLPFIDLEHNKRFCCVEHTKEFMRREQISIEENLNIY